MLFKFHIGPSFENLIEWLTNNFEVIFDGIKIFITNFINTVEAILMSMPSLLFIVIIAAIAYKVAGKGTAIFSFLGFLLIDSMQLWEQTIQTLSLVLSSAFIALLLGIPLGILSSKADNIDRIIRPIMDFMQTMPAFVYLIPAVMFFDLGEVPGAVATVIFSMPPVVRLTNLGIRQVPKDVIEAAKSFGSTENQMLFKVQLPLATPTILAGVNQTIMLSLSMVVISAMIGAGGLGLEVLKGITQLEIGKGFESGVAVVILAMVLDRITQAFGDVKS